MGYWREGCPGRCNFSGEEEETAIRSIMELDACRWGQSMNYRDNARLRVIKHQLKAKCEG